LQTLYKTRFTKHNIHIRVILKIQHMVLIFKTLVIHMINFSTLWKMEVTENYINTCIKKTTSRNNFMLNFMHFLKIIVCTKIRKCIIGHIKLNFIHKVRFSELIVWHFIMQNVCNIQWYFHCHTKERNTWNLSIQQIDIRYYPWRPFR
jgi:hypothetical protein